MKKNTPSSYVQMFEEKFKTKEHKIKTKETQPSKGINFDNLTDWDNIGPLNENSNNLNQIHPDEIYTPIVFNNLQIPSQFHPIHQDFDNNEVNNDKPTSNRLDPLNDYSVNTSNFTYKQNDLGYCDKIDLSTMNNNNNNNNDLNNVIGGKKVPLAFCENMVMSQIHKPSSEYIAITPGVIQEEDDEYKNCSKMTNDFLNEKKNANNEKDSLDEIEHITNKRDEDDDLDGNITQDQMNELNEEMNQMLHEMKVKNYVEKKFEKNSNMNTNIGKGNNNNNHKKKEGNGKIYLKQQEVNSNNNNIKAVKSINNTIVEQKIGNQQVNNSLQSAGLVTGKFGCINTPLNADNNNNNNNPMNMQGYPLSYIQQQQQTGILPLTTIPIQMQIQQQHIYQDPNGYPIQYPQSYPIHYQVPFNMSMIPSNEPQSNNDNIYNQNTYLANAQLQQQLLHPTFKNIILNPDPNQIQNDQSSTNQSNQTKKIHQYHPKTMKEYKQKYTNAPVKKRGGLGANIGTKEWEEKQQKITKIKQYSTQIKETIKDRQPPLLIKEAKNIISANGKYINNKKHEELKNQLLHDSLSDEDEDMKALNALIKESNTNDTNNNNGNDRPSQSAPSSENKIVKSANGHVNVIKNLKKDNEHKVCKDTNINYSKYKQVPIKNYNDDSTNLNKVYTTMKQQPQSQTPQLKKNRGKSLEPTRKCVNRPVSSSKLKPKINAQKSNYISEDHLTKEFMNQPSNDIISNLLQNHHAYNDKVDKIKMYLHNK